MHYARRREQFARGDFRSPRRLFINSDERRCHAGATGPARNEAASGVPLTDAAPSPQGLSLGPFLTPYEGACPRPQAALRASHRSAESPKPYPRCQRLGGSRLRASALESLHYNLLSSSSVCPRTRAQSRCTMRERQRPAGCHGQSHRSHVLHQRRRSLIAHTLSRHTSCTPGPGDPSRLPR
jgi:hypothetical protein